MAELAEEILTSSIRMAGGIGARAVLVYADVFRDRGSLAQVLGREPHATVYLATGEKAQSDEPALGAEWIRVPSVNLTRTGQIKIAVLLGFCRGHFRRGDRLVCLSGLPGSGILDMILILQVGAEFDLFRASGIEAALTHVNPEVFERVLGLATSLGYEGREGKPVGTTFVLGDAEQVLTRSVPMVLNPFRCYGDEERNILDAGLEPTVKEFATIDGAFLIRGDGTIEAAGLYLRPEATGPPLPRGLGARHTSAAGITASTNAVAITVSESTGTVTVFGRGSIMLEVEAARPGGSRAPRQDRPFAAMEQAARGIEDALSAERRWKPPER